MNTDREIIFYRGLEIKVHRWPGNTAYVFRNKAYKTLQEAELAIDRYWDGFYFANRKPKPHSKFNEK